MHESQHDSPIACVTLDLESDYVTDSFKGLASLSTLTGFCQSEQVPLTVFVEGRVLRDYSYVLSEFATETEFALHCDDHRFIPDTVQSLARGVRSFEQVLGYAPRGYRAANYRLTDELLAGLVNYGFVWDASYLPFRTHVSSCEAGMKEQPFQISQHLWELPVGVWPRTRLPFAMSYISLLGLPLIRRMINSVGWPQFPIFVFHLHDLFPTDALRRATTIRRIGHRWNYRLGLVDPFVRFARFIELLKSAGFQLVTCGAIHKKLVPSLKTA